MVVRCPAPAGTPARAETSVPIPKYASAWGLLWRTSESMRTLASICFPVCLLDLKFARRSVQQSGELQIQHTGGRWEKVNPPDGGRRGSDGPVNPVGRGRGRGLRLGRGLDGVPPAGGQDRLRPVGVEDPCRGLLA